MLTELCEYHVGTVDLIARAKFAPIGLRSVSSRSGIPRITLYCYPTRRAIVEEHRATARPTGCHAIRLGTVFGAGPAA